VGANLADDFGPGAGEKFAADLEGAYDRGQLRRQFKRGIGPRTSNATMTGFCMPGLNLNQSFEQVDCETGGAGYCDSFGGWVAAIG